MADTPSRPARVKYSYSGSIAKVETKGIAEMPTASFESAIQGKTSGVFIEQASGKLGETIKMRIRGSSSVSANNQPLYVVDGVPITTENISNADNQPTSPLADLAMTDVESIQILKDASAEDVISQTVRRCPGLLSLPSFFYHFTLWSPGSKSIRPPDFRPSDFQTFDCL